MYIQSIKSGKDYSTAEKSMAILVSDYELDSLKNVKNMHQNGISVRKNTQMSS